MLYDTYKKVNRWLEVNQKDLFLASIIILISIISFGLGRLSVIWPEKRPITITTNNPTGPSPRALGQQPTTHNNDEIQKNLNSSPNNSNPPANNAKGKYVASKNSTFYHFPWCPGALKIKEENKIWFQTKEEAENRGYKPAGNCEEL